MLDHFQELWVSTEIKWTHLLSFFAAFQIAVFLTASLYFQKLTVFMTQALFVQTKLVMAYKLPFEGNVGHNKEVVHNTISPPMVNTTVSIHEQKCFRTKCCQL